MKQLRYVGTIISQLSYDVFLISLLGYVVALSLESMKAGVVVRYFNINDLVVIGIISGILAVVLPHPPVVSRNTRWFYVALVLLSILLGFIVFQLTATLGVWAYVSGLACTLLLYSAGIMIQTDS